MMKFDKFINETDELGQKPVMWDDVNQPKAIGAMMNWLEAHGIYIQDLTKDHVKKFFNMKSDSEYDIATDKLKKMLAGKQNIPKIQVDTNKSATATDALQKIMKP